MPRLRCRASLPTPNGFARRPKGEIWPRETCGCLPSRKAGGRYSQAVVRDVLHPSLPRAWSVAPCVTTARRILAAVPSAGGRSPALARRCGLALLIAATSLVLGWQASWWLVPIYLSIMAWLLAGGESNPGVDPRVEPSENQAETLGAVVANAASEMAAPTPRKSRAGTTTPRRRRPRKIKPAAEPAFSTTSTWVQVAPGKFVRVEAAETAADGPSESPDLAETPADPASEDARPVVVTSDEAPCASGAEATETSSVPNNHFTTPEEYARVAGAESATPPSVGSLMLGRRRLRPSHPTPVRTARRCWVRGTRTWPAPRASGSRNLPAPRRPRTSRTPSRREIRTRSRWARSPPRNTTQPRTLIL